MTGPTVRYGSLLADKPFALDVEVEQLAGVEPMRVTLFLRRDQVEQLVASADAALTEHRQATCPHPAWGEPVVVGDGTEARCLLCDLLAVRHDDGTVVAVGEGT